MLAVYAQMPKLAKEELAFKAIMTYNIALNVFKKKSLIIIISYIKSRCGD